MTVMPFGLAAQAAPAAVPGTPTEPGTAPTDFMAAFLAAMSGEGGDVTLPAPSLVEAASDPGAALAPVSKPGETPSEDPTVLDPMLAALIAQQIPVIAPGFETGRAGLPQPTGTALVGAITTATPAATLPLVEEGALAPASKPRDPGAEQSDPTTQEPAVAGKAELTKEPASVLTEVPSSSSAAPSLPATAIQPSSTQPTAPTAPVTAPAANTSPLDRVSAQVFGEVTSLVSRGNGTHRITMTLNPEQLGEVRVVMTIRDGAVHVRMAAGHEASAALLGGSPELSRLLESAGATESRIVVRELPATPTTPDSNPNDPNSTNTELDQHAGTRADHQAKDGSDQNTPRPARADGATSTGPSPRSIHPVIGTRAAGLDLTM